MVINDFSIPFYLMQSKEKTNPSEYPTDSNDEIYGLEEAIRNTERGIVDGKYDKSELNSHLEGLKQQLAKTRESQRTKGKK